MAWFASHPPAAVTQFRGEGATRGLPSATYPVDDVHRIRIAWGVGDGHYVWGVQKEGSVDELQFTLKLHPCTYYTKGSPMVEACM